MARMAWLIPAGIALVSAWSLPAAQPSVDDAFAALSRDLDRYAACRRAADAECLTALTHAESSVVSNRGRRSATDSRLLTQAPDEFDPQASLATYLIAAPTEPLRSGDRLYNLIPYTAERPVSSGWGRVRAYLIGISDDAGANWRFVDGAFVAPNRIERIIPDLDPRELPMVDLQVVPAPPAVRSRYLQTSRGGFYYDGEAAAYTLTVEVTRPIDAALDVTVLLDDPQNAMRRREYRSNLAPDQDTLDIVSPVMRGFTGGRIYNVTLTGSDATTGEVLFEHRQPLLFGAGGPITVAGPSR